jgi:hypothetical protein
MQDLLLFIAASPCFLYSYCCGVAIPGFFFYTQSRFLPKNN